MKNDTEKIKLLSLRLRYWEKRCQLAEKYIKEDPCDPDMYSNQAYAYEKWQKQKEKQKPK